MGVKVEVLEDCKKEEINYPYLMIGNSTGVIVLFSSEREGVVVGNPTGYNGLGYHSKTWEMANFKPLKGKITLENK